MKPSEKQRGNSMVGILAAMAIILILALVFFFGGFGKGGGLVQKSTRADQKGITVPGAVRYKAKDEVCRNNLSQIRAAIQVAEASSEDGFPKSLDELRLPPDILHCSIAPYEPYTYDPATGTVHCPHPGHEKY